MVELIYIDIRCHIYRIRDRKKKKINREYSGTVNIVGVDRKLIIMFIFVKALTVPHNRFFGKWVGKQVCKEGSGYGNYFIACFNILVVAYGSRL